MNVGLDNTPPCSLGHAVSFALIIFVWLGTHTGFCAEVHLSCNSPTRRIKSTVQIARLEWNRKPCEEWLKEFGIFGLGQASVGGGWLSFRLDGPLAAGMLHLPPALQIPSRRE